MSAPDTNTEKEEKRHKPSLLGIRGVLVFVAILLIGWLVWVFAAGVGDEDQNPTEDSAPTSEAAEQEGQASDDGAATEDYEGDYDPGANSDGSVDGDAEAAE